MSTFFYVYISLWVSACLLAIVLYVLYRESFSITCQGYVRFLFKSWKIVTFVISATGLTLIAPYTGDPTWDYVDAMFMSLLTYFTAPWAIGVLFKALKRELSWKHAYVAFCVWLFSASWSYDLYILLRHGSYPITWFSNIFASSVLYILAGLLWNLDWRTGRGLIFSFMEHDWPGVSIHSVFPKVLSLALPIMALVGFLILFFFLVY
jgi:hypothetical protein